MTPKVMELMQQFVAYLSEKGFPLRPLTPEDVCERQNTRAKRNIAANADQTVPGGNEPAFGSAFMKAEPSVGDPRIIVSFDDKFKIEYARFTYALQAFCEEHLPFYCFGRSPAEIADKIAEMAMRATCGVLETDVRRMDGCTGEIQRTLEKMIWMAAFPQEWPELRDLLERGEDMWVKYNKKHYQPGFKRSSGSMDTAVMNTLQKAFMVFVAYAMSGPEPTANLEMALAAGDDGSSPDLTLHAMEKAANMVGFKIKTEWKQKHVNPLHFLSRVYGMEVWNGSTENVADLARALKRLHVTVPRPDPPAAILRSKLLSARFNDRNTPVIGHMVRRYEELAGPLTQLPGDEQHLTFSARCTPDRSASYQAGEEIYEWAYGLLSDYSPVALENLLHHIERATTVEDLLNCPSLQPELPTVEKPGMVIHNDGTPVGTTAAPKQAEKSTVEVTPEAAVRLDALALPPGKPAAPKKPNARAARSAKRKAAMISKADAKPAHQAAQPTTGPNAPAAQDDGPGTSSKPHDDAPKSSFKPQPQRRKVFAKRNTGDERWRKDPDPPQGWTPPRQTFVAEGTNPSSPRYAPSEEPGKTARL
jgi:hypothetical protein